MRGGQVLRRRAARAASAVLLAAVAATVVVAPGAEAQTGPTITLDPAAGHTDATRLTVTGAGFTPGTQVIASQCEPGFTGDTSTLRHCTIFQGGSSAFGTTDADGAVTLALDLDTVLYLSETQVVDEVPQTVYHEHDCRIAECEVVVGGLGEAARAPLAFDPGAPLSGTATVTPAGDLQDAQWVSVAGSGWNQSRRIRVRECVADPTAGVLCQARRADLPFTANDGLFAVNYRVDAIFSSEQQPGVRGEDCRVTDRCLLRVDVPGDPTEPVVDIPLTFGPGGPLAPPPVVTVTPHENLIHQEQVTVTGTGYWNESPEIRQCAPGGDWYDTCTLVGTGSAYSTDTFTTQVRLSAVLDFPSIGAVDCRTSAQPCEIQVSSVGQSSRLTRVPLQFDPEGPDPTDPNAPPKVTVAPAADLAHLQTVRVTASGFIPDQPDITVAQCGGPAGDACLELGRTQSNRAGRAELDVLLRAEWERGPDEIIDCRATPGCRIVMSGGTKVGTSAEPGFAPSAHRRYVDRVFDATQVSTADYRQVLDHLGADVTLGADIYQPVGDTATKRPVIVFSDSGLWFLPLRSLGFYRATIRDLTRRGYVVAFLDTRLRSNVVAPFTTSDPDMRAAAFDAYDDITAGIDWLRDHAAEYRIDPGAIGIVGVSTGAVTAFDMAYLPGQRGSAASPVDAAVAISGANLGTPEAGEPPVLAFHGAADRMAPSPAATCDTAVAAGLRCDVVTFPGADHRLLMPTDGFLEIGHKDEVVQRSAEFLAEALVGSGVTADAGGPYSVVEGSTVPLDGSASEGDGVSYLWAPADRVDDSTSATPTLRGIDDGTETLTLTVTDTHGISDSTTVDVTTSNAPPAIPTLTVTATGQTVDVQAAITDPGVEDTHTAVADWGDGTTSPLAVSGRAATGSHPYAEPGRYTVKITATDDDGASATAEHQVVVGCTIVGTDRNDLLLGTRGHDVICGLGGHDLIAGLDGNDHIYGGTGNDLLLGGRGNDHLAGGPGLDFAIGAEGTNTCTAEIRRSCTSPR